MADEELVVKVEDEAPPEGEGIIKPEAEPELLASLKQQLETSQADVEREAQARRDAEQRAQTERAARAEVEKQYAGAQEEVTSTRLAKIDQEVSAAQAQADAAQTTYASAMQEGNWTEAAKQQRLMARAEAEVVARSSEKQYLEAQKPQEVRTRQVEVQQPPSDPIEAFISGNGRANEAQGWLRSHKDYWASDGKIEQRKLMKIDAAHTDALAEGMTANTPQYFAHVEKFLNMTKEPVKNGKDAGEIKVAAHTRRAASAPVAPVSAGGGVTNGGVAEVTLTKREADAAKDGTLTWNRGDLAAGRIKDEKLIGSPIGIQEFARRKKTMSDQGLYGPQYTDN